MSEKICANCGKPMECLKTGFLFHCSLAVHRGDLFGCRSCERFQIHGINKVSTPVSRIDSLVGVIQDPHNEQHYAVTEGDFHFTKEFDEHMKQWYPHWNWEDLLQEWDWFIGGANETGQDSN